MIDIALTEDESTGKTIAHRLDCPVVVQCQCEGRKLMKLREVWEPLPRDMRLHDCLKS